MASYDMPRNIARHVLYQRILNPGVLTKMAPCDVFLELPAQSALPPACLGDLEGLLGQHAQGLLEGWMQVEHHLLDDVRQVLTRGSL